MKSIILTFTTLLISVLSFSQNKTSYEITHGEKIKGCVAPYIYDYCENNNLNIDKIKNAVFSKKELDSSKFASYPIILSSTKHITGRWTFYKSERPLIYELEKLNNDIIVVLYSTLNPYQILDTNKAEWVICLLNNKYKKIDEKTFLTNLKYENSYLGMWDMIQTNLENENNITTIEISYLHTGGGGAREQSFLIKAGISNKIESLNIEQTIDNYFQDE
ncbi:MAG: hypothetical protein JXL97_16175 [Bacteroidales bacterium]|nr:hypothetical protein [Bacteroidales bacterium]